MADHEEYLKAIADAVNDLSRAMTESNERTSGKTYYEARKAGLDVGEAGNKSADKYANSPAGKLRALKDEQKEEERIAREERKAEQARQKAEEKAEKEKQKEEDKKTKEEKKAFKKFTGSESIGLLYVKGMLKLLKHFKDVIKEALESGKRYKDINKNISGFVDSLDKSQKALYNAENLKEEANQSRSDFFVKYGIAGLIGEIKEFVNELKLKWFNDDRFATELGVSDATKSAYDKQLVTKFETLGVDYKSAITGAAAYESTAKAISDKHGVSWKDALDSLMSGNAGGYGIYGIGSLQYEGWLYSQGMLKDYMNQAEIESYYAVYMDQMSDLMIENTDELRNANETNAKLGLQAQAVGKGLQSFDEVLNLSAKSTNIPTISTNKEGKIAVNNEKTITKEKEKQTQQLRDYVDAMSVLLNGEDAMVQALIDQGYSAEYAEEKVKAILELMKTDPDRAILDWIQTFESDASITLEDIQEMDNIIRNMTGKSLIITASLDYSELDIESLKAKFKDINFGSGSFGIDTSFNVGSLIITDEQINAFIKKVQEKLNNSLINVPLQGVLKSIYVDENGVTIYQIDGSQFDMTVDDEGIIGPTTYFTIPKNGDGGSSNTNHHANGGIITQQELSWLAEGNKAEAVIPLETQGGIDYLAAAMQKAGGTASGAEVVVNCTLNGELLEMNDYSVRRLGDKLADIIQNRINQRGDINYGN